MVVKEDRRPSVRVVSLAAPALGRSFWAHLGRAIATFIVAAGAVFLLAPLVWMLSTSLKEPGQVLLLPPVWLPHPIVWHNYPAALSFMQASVVYRNSAIITSLNVSGQVLSSSLVGFAFARLHTPGKNVLFMLVLSTIMLPFQAVLVPQFILFKYLGWVNTFFPLIVPSFLGGPFFIFLMRQFFASLSSELDDAARIDGCGYFGLYWRIGLPLSLPAVGVVAIMTFMGSWNDFLHPLIYLNSASRYTVALALQNFTADYGMTPWNLLMAASLVALLPCIVLFFIAQRFFIQGIVVTGVKG
ncbi:MAG: carbohydrate ABC transporter permease [Chloroflexi bacterium]|nr:carbohydrate ABC transporter permease [Chloroflexota bacterium]